MRTRTGIFVKDFIDLVPIDKYFELFKPNAGGEGGFIRISLNFVSDLAELDGLRQGERTACMPHAWGMHATCMPAYACAYMRTGVCSRAVRANVVHNAKAYRREDLVHLARLGH